jgi:hypothetical protein
MNVKIKSVILILVLLLSASIFFKRGFARIQKGRQYEIEKVEELEKSKSYLPAMVHSITGEPIPKTIGHVKGILYSENKSSTIIGDENSIVYEENSIYGATIVKIHKDKVKFAKNSQSWTQKVGEPPGPEWYR